MKKEKIARTVKRRSLKERGITLVALVVTIIILLILAGVTLNIALSENGLFRRARESAKRYENASENETEILDNLDKTLAELSRDTIDRGDLKVGDIVLYTPTKYVDNDTDAEDNGYTLLGSQSGKGTYSESTPKTLEIPEDQTIPQETYTWRVLNIDKIGNVEIVGVPTSENKHKDIYFQGALGYNNGVYLLDNICNKLYSNKELGVTARSIDLEDIQKGMSKEGIKENTPIVATYTYTGSKAYYPELYKYQKDSGVEAEDEGELKKDGINESDAVAQGITIPINTGKTVTSQGYSQAKSLKVKNTGIYKSQQAIYYNDEVFYNMMFPSEISYWLGARFSGYYSDHIIFGLLYVSNGNLRNFGLFNSGAGSPVVNYCICPVVSLGTNIQLTKDASGNWTPSKIK